MKYKYIFINYSNKSFLIFLYIYSYISLESLVKLTYNASLFPCVNLKIQRYILLYKNEHHLLLFQDYIYLCNVVYKILIEIVIFYIDQIFLKSYSPYTTALYNNLK